MAFVLPWFRRFGLTVFGLFLLIGSMLWMNHIDGFTKLETWAEYQTAEILGDAGFRVNNVLVEGREYSDGAVLLALINVQKGDPMFLVNPREAQDLIEQMEWIRSAHVERRLPDTIFVQLKERQPSAFWKKGNDLVLLDERGEVIDVRALSQFKGLPLLAGTDAPKHAPQLLGLLNGYVDLRKRVQAAAWVGDRRWDLQMKNATLIKLPEEGVEEAITLLMNAQGQEGLLDKDIHSIDLREPGRIVIRTKPGEATEYFQKHEASFQAGDDI